MKRASALLVLLFVCCIHPTSAQTVPTPESVLGHKPGDDFYLASYDESREYFRKLDFRLGERQVAGLTAFAAAVGRRIGIASPVMPEFVHV